MIRDKLHPIVSRYLVVYYEAILHQAGTLDQAHQYITNHGSWRSSFRENLRVVDRWIEPGKIGENRTRDGYLLEYTWVDSPSC